MATSIDFPRWASTWLTKAPNGACADRLDEFLGRVDAEIVQAFPPACVPIKRGAVRRSLDPFLR